jgi:hypothetical protein
MFETCPACGSPGKRTDQHPGGPSEFCRECEEYREREIFRFRRIRRQKYFEEHPPCSP